MRRLICAVIALMMLAASISGGIAENTDGQIQNCILIIDNSRCAADPEGMRFDAAKLLYDEVLSAARAGVGGKLGVVVFCGPNNCVSYGPADLSGDARALDAEIGSCLSTEANRARRDNYTDINTALEAVRSMMLDFSGGDTRLIMLANSGNDLTDAPDPYSQVENIKANDRTVQAIEELREQGATLQIIAFTSLKDALFTEAFMAFVSRIAKAGGGVRLADGGYDNVLSVTRTDMSVKLLQWLNPVGITTGDVVHDAVEYTPASTSFAIEGEDVGATVAVALMPSDRDRLESLALVSPDGASVALYEAGGVRSQGDIAATEDGNRMQWDIPSLQPGEWQLSATGKNGAEIPIQIAICLRRDPRQGAASAEQTAAIDGTSAGAPQAGARGDGSSAADTGAPQPGAKGGGSSAAGAGAPQPGAKGDGSSAAGAGAPQPGAISGGSSAGESVDVSSDDLKKGFRQIVDTVKEEGKVTIPVDSEGENFSWEIEAEPDADQIRVSWQGDELTNTLAELREKGSNNLLLSGIHPDDAIELGLLEDDVEYVLLINAFSSDEEEDGAGERIQIQALDLKLVPEGDLVEGTTLNVANAVLALSPVISNSNMDVQQLTQATQAIQGTLADSGDSGGSGAPESAGQSNDADGSGKSEDEPEDAPADESSSLSAAAILSIVWSFLKHNWMYFAGVAGLLALIIAIAITQASKVKKVSGKLQISCDELNLHQAFRFEGRGRLKLDSPLTQYPDIAKQKGTRIYTVLSTLRVDMTQADEFGKVPGSDAQYKLSEDLIKVIYTDPRTNREEVRYVSQYDTSESVLSIFVGGRTYDLTLSSNLSFDDLLYAKR